MPVYRYRAINALGKTRQAQFTSTSEIELVRSLNAEGLTVLAIDEVPVAAVKTRGGRQAVSLFTRQLANFVHSNVPLPKALQVLAEHQRDFPAAPLLAREVASGTAFADALAKHPKLFDKVYVGLVRSGMESARLDTVLTELADHLEQEQIRRQKLLLALSYPLLVAGVSFLVIIAMLTYVMPQVVQAFSSGRQQLPWLTQTLMSLSAFIATHAAWLVFLAVMAVAGLLFLARHPKCRGLWQRLVLATPILGQLTQELAASRYLDTLAMLQASGTVLLPAMRTARQVMAFEVHEHSLLLAEEAVQRGVTLTEALQGTALFDPMQLELIRSGEHSSQLLASLNKAAQWQSDRVQHKLNWLTGLIEPALIVLMGGLVLILVLAVMLPIVSINRLVA
ncbi:MAG: type secretion system inner membrane protein GspF [Pseudomonadota bacterium]